MVQPYNIRKGDWVRTPDGVGVVRLIEERHVTLPVTYPKPVHVQFSNRTVSYKYIELDKLTFLEFALHGPKGKKGFGLNERSFAYIAHAFALLLWITAIASQVVDPPSMSVPWAVFTAVFGVAILAVVWIKTYHNFTGQTR